MRIVIGIDIGTGSTKAIAYDTMAYKPLAHHQEFYPTIKEGRFHEQNPKLIYQAFIKCVQEVASKVKKESIVALSFSSALHSLIALDANYQPLTNCLLWSDSRSHEQTKKLKSEKVSEQLYFNTGTPIHAMSPLMKIKYFGEEQTSLFSKIKKYISIKSYIIYQIIGKLYEDESLASATGIFNIAKRIWDPRALAFLGIDKNQLPEVVPTDKILPTIPENIAATFQVPKTIALIIGGGDGPLANLGAMCMKPGMGCITFGTSGAIRVANKNVIKDLSKTTFSYIVDNDYYVIGGATNNGGIVLKWIAKSFLDQSENSFDIQEIVEKVSQIKPGCDGLICLPWIIGERAPVWDADAKGMFVGLNQIHNKAHFIRAAVEGILYNAKIILSTVEDITQPISTINFNGGLAKSDTFAQMLADITGKTVQVSSVSDASTLGAIFLAMKALNMINSFEELNQHEDHNKIFTPNNDHLKIYKQNYESYKLLAGHYKLFTP